MILSKRLVARKNGAPEPPGQPSGTVKELSRNPEDAAQAEATILRSSPKRTAVPQIQNRLRRSLIERKERRSRAA